MYNQSVINLEEPSVTRKNQTKFNQIKETFQDVFQRTMNNNSDSRPPKIELTGVLTPVRSSLAGIYRYKLETDLNEYYLKLSERHAEIAKKLAWEEVTVKGYLDPDSKIIEVEKIYLSPNYDDLDFWGKGCSLGCGLLETLKTSSRQFPADGFIY